MTSFESYAASRDDPRFTDWLRERAEPGFTDAATHRFTRELADDAVDDAVFRRYLVQDYAFVDALAGLVGHAAGAAPSMDAKARLAEFLVTLATDENDYFERSFDALSVPPDDRADPPVAPVTRAFRTLLEAAESGGYEEALAVLVPAEWIYLEWARDASGSEPSRFYLAEWIDLHAGPAFESFVGWLRGQLDDRGPALSPSRRERVADLFTYAVDLEVAFFDAAYEGGERDEGGGRVW